MGFVAELGGEFSTLVASKLRVRSERDDLIAALYEEGLPVAVIAERAGVCVKTVRNVARRIGLPARSRLVKALARHGIVPRKTASMRLSEQASRRAAVWLGVLDGDGSVGIYKSGRAPRFYFAGTEALMAQCERFWRTELAIEGPQPTARPHTKGIWTFSLACAKAEAAADALIGASPISMRRKRALLAQIAGRTA